MATAPIDATLGLYRYRFGSAEFDQSTFELRVGGVLVDDVQPRPLEVLLELLQRPNEVMTRQQLQETVWRGRPTVDNVIGNTIKKLRIALGANAEFIENKHGVGYRFAGPLERMVIGRSQMPVVNLTDGMVVPGQPGFVLQQELSQSTRSTVWRASHDDGDEARVFKFCTDGEGLAALKREATVSRGLAEAYPERTDFVRVLEQNFTTTPFWLAFDDAGQHLADWATPERLARLGLPERLDLFLRIADAVAAAHAIGVLHKDLKPANVLIDACDQVRLTDFGSSRLLDPQYIQQLGVSQLGFNVTTVGDTADATPLYLAPEILSQQSLTVRTDIYALGVILYQIVTGNFQQPLVPGWERTIDDDFIRQDIARATDVDPEHRFAGVAQFTESLRAIERRREEQRKSVEAARTAEATRLAYLRERARRPWLLATIIVLSLGLGVVIWFATQLAVATTTATTAAERADATKSFLLDMLRGADPALGKGYDITLKETLKRSAVQIPARFAQTPATETEVQQTAADLYTSLNDYPAAITHVTRVITLLTAQAGETDARTLRARYELGRLLAQQGNVARAEHILRAADRAAASLVPEQNLKMALAGANAWTTLHFVKTGIAAALPFIDKAERYQLALDPQDGAALLSIRVDRANVYNQTGRAKEAAQLLADLDAPLYDEKTVGKAMRAEAISIHGAALLYSGQLDQAQRQLEAALRALSTIYGPNSPQAMQSHVRLGQLYATRDDVPRALAHVAPSRDFFCTTYGPTQPVCLQQTVNEGILRLMLGDHVRAAPTLRQALAAYRSLGHADNALTVQLISYYLATALVDLDQGVEAEQLASYLDAQVLATASPGEGWDLRLHGLNGSILIAQGKRAAGLVLLRPALAELDAGKAQQFILAPLRRALQRGANRK